eukprot:gene9839-20461_t
MNFFDDGYILASLPIIIGHLALPPLSYYSGSEGSLWQEFVPDLLPSEEIMKSLSFDFQSFDLSHPQWTWITHLFVHADYGHLFNNLTAAIQFGLPVYKMFGATGMNILFIGGGVFASFPTILYKYERERLSKDIQAIVSADSSYIPKFISNIWNKTVSSLSNKFVNNIPKKFIGSSGAVCACMGADLVIMCKECYDVISDEYRAENNPRTASSSSSRTSGLSTGRWEIFVKSFENFKTNHVAHIQGAIFGVLFATLFGTVIPYFRKRNKRRTYYLPASKHPFIIAYLFNRYLLPEHFAAPTSRSYDIVIKSKAPNRPKEFQHSLLSRNTSSRGVKKLRCSEFAIICLSNAGSQLDLIKEDIPSKDRQYHF